MTTSKRLLSILLALMLTFSLAFTAQALPTPSINSGEEIIMRVYGNKGVINGEYTRFTNADITGNYQIIQYYNNKAIVPLRFVAEKLGGEAGWINSPEAAIIEINGLTLTYEVGSSSLVKTGIDGVNSYQTLAVPAHYINGSIFVGLRDFADAIGYYVDYTVVNNNEYIYIAKNAMSQSQFMSKIGEFEEKLSNGYVPVNGISLNIESKTISQGNSLALTSTISPTTATNKTVVWTSDKPSVASVNQNGIVTGVSSGTASIKVTTACNNESYICYITVGPSSFIQVTGLTVSSQTSGVTLEPLYGRMNKNVSVGLAADISPSNAANKNVKWSSSNIKAATINSDTGIIKGLDEGFVKFTATSLDNGSIKGDYYMSLVSLFEQSSTARVSIEGTRLNVRNGASTQAPIKKDTSGSGIALADGTEVILLGSCENWYYIQLTGGIASPSGLYGFVSKNYIDTDAHVTDISISSETSGVTLQDSYGRMNKSVNVKLKANITPDNASNKDVVWTSGDTSIARIDPDTGEVTGVNEGFVTFTATSVDAESEEASRLAPPDDGMFFENNLWWRKSS